MRKRVFLDTPLNTNFAFRDGALEPGSRPGRSSLARTSRNRREPESFEMTAGQASLQASSTPLLGFIIGDMLQRLNGAPAPGRRESDRIIKPDGSDPQAEPSQSLIKACHGPPRPYICIVAPKTDPRPENAVQGISLFVVEAGTPGYTKGRRLAKMGMASQDTAELAFEEFKAGRARS